MFVLFFTIIHKNWQLIANLGLKLEVIEEITFNSIYYPYDFTVKAYVNYQEKYYKLYDKDVIFDDYIGRTSIKLETGYTVKVLPQ